MSGIETRVTRLERLDRADGIEPITRIVLVPLRGPGEPERDEHRNPIQAVIYDLNQPKSTLGAGT